MAKNTGGRSKSSELDLVDLQQAVACIAQSREELVEVLADRTLTNAQRHEQVKKALGNAHCGMRFIEEVLERNDYFKD